MKEKEHISIFIVQFIILAIISIFVLYILFYSLDVDAAPYGGVTIGVPIIFAVIISISYVNFRKKHEKHAEELNKAIIEFVEKCELTYSGHEIHLTYFRTKDVNFPELYVFDNIPNKYWNEVVEHLKSGSTYKEVAEIYTLLTVEIENYNLSAKHTLHSIDQAVEKDLQKTFPEFIYELRGREYILKDTIVEYIWREFWFSKSPDSKPSTINFKIENVQMGKPGDHIYSKIHIDGFATLLASVPVGVDITDKLREFLEKMVSNPKFKQSILKILEKREKVETTFKEFKAELSKLSKAVESNHDIDGKCNFCPGMYGL